MTELFRDPVWQFIGAVLGLLTIITSLILYIFQRKNKKLSYDIIYASPLMSAQKRILKKLRILFDRKPVDNIHLVVLKLMNTGNVPIISSDYEKKIELSFGNNVTLLSSEVIRTEPRNLEVNIENIKNKIVIDPLLLNPKDAISVETIVSGENIEVDVNTRIIGIQKVERGLDIIPMIPFTSLGYLGMIIGLTILISGIIKTGFSSELEKYFVPGVGAIIAGFYLILLRSLMRSEKYRPKLIELIRAISKLMINK